QLSGWWAVRAGPAAPGISAPPTTTTAAASPPPSTTTRKSLRRSWRSVNGGRRQRPGTPARRLGGRSGGRWRDEMAAPSQQERERLAKQGKAMPDPERGGRVPVRARSGRANAGRAGERV